MNFKPVYSIFNHIYLDNAFWIFHSLSKSYKLNHFNVLAANLLLRYQISVYLRATKYRVSSQDKVALPCTFTTCLPAKITIHQKVFSLKSLTRIEIRFLINLMTWPLWRTSSDWFLIHESWNKSSDSKIKTFLRFHSRFSYLVKMNEIFLSIFSFVIGFPIPIMKQCFKYKAEKEV